MGGEFNSPLFQFTMKNFNLKRTEFCYAGDWSGVLNLETGILRKCYCDDSEQNIFENPQKPIDFHAIGCCGSLFCMNSSHFLSLGVIPTVYQEVSYAGLRNREEANWYSNEMKYALSHKLSDTNQKYTVEKERRVYKKRYNKYCINRQIKKLKSIVKSIIRRGN